MQMRGLNWKLQSVFQKINDGFFKILETNESNLVFYLCLRHIFTFALTYNKRAIFTFYKKKIINSIKILMFFGKQIQPNTPSALSLIPFSFPIIQINNAALSKTSQQAELYLKIQEQEILICELNRNLGVLQCCLNLLIDLRNLPELVAKNGYVHVCGYYQGQNINDLQGQNTEVLVQTARNKSSDSLSSKFHKAQTLLPQTLSTSTNVDKKKSHNQNQSPKESSQKFSPRQSSRLQSRRSSSTNPTNPEPPKLLTSEEKPQKSHKTDHKQSKKSGQQKALLSNGRYNLKALLQNIEDDDSDEESQVFFDEDEDDDSDEDDEFDGDQSEDEEEEKRAKKKVKQTNDTENKNNKKCEGQERQAQHKQKPHKKGPIEVIEEESSEKIEGNTLQFQQKWPQNAEEHQSADSQVEKKIQELASRLKVPTMKPSI